MSGAEPSTRVEESARRFAYLFALPVPVCETQESPLLDVILPDAPLETWWATRRDLAQLAGDIQGDLIRVTTLPTNEDQLDKLAIRLDGVLAQVQLVQTNWETIYAEIVFAGSAKLFQGDFSPFWLTPGKTFLYELCDEVDKGQQIPRNSSAQLSRPPMREHCEPSFVLENCALALMLCVCKQQLATLAQLRAGPEALQQAAFMLREALMQCNIIITRILPMYYAVKNGSESFLLNEHFYTAFVRPLIEAQLAYVTATHIGAKNGTHRLHGVAELTKSARLLKQASRTLYSNLQLDALAIYRHSSALLLLGSLLYDASEQVAGEIPLLSIQYTVGESMEVTPYCLLVEALACVRIAALLLGTRFPAIVKLLQSIIDAAQTLPRVYISLIQVDVDAALNDAELATTWRRSVQLNISDTYAAFNTILCAHRATQTTIVNLDTPRIYTICVTPPPKMSPTQSKE